MRKILAVLAVGLVVGLMATSVQAAAQQREKGGPMAFFAGCCFGPRCAADFNDGKRVHINEWGRLIPVYGIYVAIMTGIDGSNGLGRKDIAAKYGSEFY